MSDTRTTVAIAFALCLCTYFAPLFNISPAAFGKTEWSALDIVALAPTAKGLFPTIVRRLWVIYLVLGVGLLLLFLPRYVKPVSVCAWVALGLTGAALRSCYALPAILTKILKAQTGWRDGTISVHPEALVLPALLIFVLFLLWFESDQHRDPEMPE